MGKSLSLLRMYYDIVRRKKMLNLVRTFEYKNTAFLSAAVIIGKEFLWFNLEYLLWLRPLHTAATIFHTATVRPKRSGPRILLYNTSLNLQHILPRQLYFNELSIFEYPNTEFFLRVWHILGYRGLFHSRSHFHILIWDRLLHIFFPGAHPPVVTCYCTHSMFLSDSGEFG